MRLFNKYIFYFIKGEQLTVFNLKQSAAHFFIYRNFLGKALAKCKFSCYNN